LLATIKVDSQMMGQFDFMQDEPTVRAGVRAHHAAGAEAIKVWYIDVPDSLHPWAKAMLFAAADEARKAGLPLIVHATELPNAKEAVQAGAKVLVHNVDTGTIDTEFLQAVKRAGTIVIPTLTVLEGYMDVAMGRSPELRYPLDCVDPATRRKLETVLPDSLTRRGREFWNSPGGRSLMTTSMDNLGRLYRAGVPIAMGTDAGNPGTAHGPSVYREMELMQQAGMPAAAVFASATIVAARAMGLEGDVGSVEKGKRADLAVFEADPTHDIANARRVRFVVRNGVLHSREELLPK
jgi:imidazolonepropionase-like amidohydrolase